MYTDTIKEVLVKNTVKIQNSHSLLLSSFCLFYLFIRFHLLHLFSSVSIYHSTIPICFRLTGFNVSIHTDFDGDEYECPLSVTEEKKDRAWSFLVG